MYTLLNRAAINIFLHIVLSIFTPYNRDMYCTLMLLLEISTVKLISKHIETGQLAMWLEIFALA
jgi:hypothetical protein